MGLQRCVTMEFDEIQPMDVVDPRDDRSYPPLGTHDTIIMRDDSPIQSVHGKGILFKKEEILKVHAIVKRDLLSPHVENVPYEGESQWEQYYAQVNQPVYVSYTEHGKAIIQQQSTRGCTAAVTAMLIKDHGQECNIDALKKRNLGRHHDKINDIKGANLFPVVKTISNLPLLKEAIKENGSAIVGINGELGAHCVVVDEIGDASVRLRDPYHGWEVTVEQEAFVKRFNNDAIIQIQKGAI